MSKKDKEDILKKFELNYKDMLATNTYKAYLTALKQLLSGSIKITSKSKYCIYKAVLKKLNEIGIKLDIVLPKYTKKGNNDKENILDKSLDDMKLEKILNELKQTKSQVELKKAIELAYRTGLRLNEVLNIKESDIVELDSIFVINVKGKGSKLRKVYLNKKYAYLVTKWQDFTISDSYCKLAINRISSRLNINFSFHSLRHSFAIQSLQKLNVIELQRILGHSNLNTTSTYLKYMNDSSIIEKLS